MRNRLLHFVYSLVSFTLILLVWSLVSSSGFVNEIFLPSPLKVLQAIGDLFSKYNFINDIGVSLLRVLTGFVIASLLGVPFGVLIGLSRRVETLLEPPIDFIRYTPIPAFVPLFVLWFGIGETEKIIVISASVFFQLVLMVANSVSHIPKDLVESALTLGAKRWQIIFRVIYQHARPRIFDDLRVSMGWAWAGLTIAEIVGSTSGLGFVIIQAQRLLQTANVIAVLIVIGALGILFDYALKRLYTLLFPWVDKVKHNVKI